MMGTRASVVWVRERVVSGRGAGGLEVMFCRRARDRRFRSFNGQNWTGSIGLKSIVYCPCTVWLAVR